MPLTTTQTAPSFFEEACAIITPPNGLRPVSRRDPAGFLTGRVGPVHADYGKVFASQSADPRLTRYDFDRDGYSFARLCPAPDGEWLEVQGRLFRIEVGQ